MQIILASRSESRKKIMDELGLKYKCVPSDAEEKIKKDISNPEELVKKTAEAKAEDIASKHKDSLIISADSVAEFGNKILEKPKNLEEAKDMLRILSGKTHNFLTGICVINTETGRKWVKLAKRKVKFKKLSGSFIDEYVKKYPVLSWAGAYHVKFGNISADKISCRDDRALPKNILIPILEQNKIKQRLSLRCLYILAILLSKRMHLMATM